MLMSVTETVIRVAATAYVSTLWEVSAAHVNQDLSCQGIATVVKVSCLTNT